MEDLEEGREGYYRLPWSRRRFARLDPGDLVLRIIFWGIELMGDDLCSISGMSAMCWVIIYY
jgi:hypothetical protein